MDRIVPLARMCCYRHVFHVKPSTARICANLRSEMGKGCKVVVCGQAAVGKTAILEQLLYGNHVVGT